MNSPISYIKEILTMKKINWITALILNIVTCGIYSLYMFYVISKNNNELAEKNDVKPITSFIVAFLLGMVTCSIYLIYWYYKLMEQQVAINKASGANIAISDNPIVLTVCMFVPILSFYVLCENYNAGVGE